MLTQLKTYEGVPVGSNNFEDFLGYVRAFLGANFGFSTNVLSNNGGYFDDDDFVFTTFGSAGTPSTQMHAFMPQTKEAGSLFGELNEEYYRFEVLGPATSDAPQVYRWDLLPTHASEVGGYRFSNTDFENKVLPYNPISLTSNVASDGYNYISYNGVYQDNTHYTQSFSSSPGTFREQHLTINDIHVGAESPTPIKNNGRFFGDLAFDPTNIILITGGGITNNLLGSEFGNRLAFPYTNFSLGGHVILTRTTVSGNTYYVYVPEDTSVGEEVSTGFYKVVNKSRGLIELSLSNAQLTALVDPSDPNDPDLDADIPFYVISAEQLLIERQGALTNYRTRYGNVYNGDDDEVRLLRLVFDGTVYQLTEISPQEHISSSGSALLQDTTGQYDDSTILALSYDITPNLNEYTQAQQNRYVPDTFQLYYHAGLIADEGATSNVRAFVEQNESSWYNQKSSTAQFYPVNRAVSTYVSYITDSEATNLTGITTFNPNKTFRIVDTLSLKNLSDIYGGSGGGTEFDDYYGVNPGGADDTILKFDSGSGNFVAVKHLLNEINNVSVGGAVGGQVLTYDGSVWSASTIESILGYTPLNKAGGTVDSSGWLRYARSMAPGTYDINILTNVQYVDGSISDHNDERNVHDATSENTGGTIIQRDGSGNASVSNPPAGYSDNSSNIATANWINDVVSSTGPTANRLAKRDDDGRIEAADPSTNLLNSSTNSDVVTAKWLYAWTASANAGNHLVVRDGNGNAHVSSPVAGGHIANRDYVDAAISALGTDVGTSFGSGWAAVGNLYIAWVQDYSTGDTSGFTVVGPTLPSGSYSLLTAWVTTQANQNGLTAQVTMRQDQLYIDGNRRPRMTISIDDTRGGSAWGSRAHWLIRKTG